MRSLSMLTLLMVGGCLTPTASSFNQCELDLSLDVPTGAPGDEVTVSGRPLTAELDTEIRVGGVTAAIIDMDRADCEPCDSCRLNADCTVCEKCATCDEICVTCDEYATFVVPAVAAGDAPVVVSNGYGLSDSLSFEVVVEEPTD
ncbi:MAG: hypothetical protein ACI9MC_002204 [Kiritimatiellia bacterium]|jgi:hypothetical protein